MFNPFCAAQQDGVFVDAGSTNATCQLAHHDRRSNENDKIGVATIGKLMRRVYI